MSLCSFRLISFCSCATDGTDKSRDDHKYTGASQDSCVGILLGRGTHLIGASPSDVYATLFDPIRESARNVTEIGIALGQSLQLWHDYFPRANLWGIDIRRDVIRLAQKMFAAKPRVHIMMVNSGGKLRVSQLGLSHERWVSPDCFASAPSRATLDICARLLTPWLPRCALQHGCDHR